MATNTGWTREQLLVALNLYCQIPFGRMDSRNPEVIARAQLIGRTPAAVAMKLVNFASLDQAIISTGRRGLTNASAADKAIWEEMHENWERFTVEARQAPSIFGAAPLVDDAITSDEDIDYTGANAAVETTTRIGQGFFRRAVLSAYNNRCCITGLGVPTLLIASHIVPWRDDPKNRLNPRNGLCLSVLHDRAFDLGIITVDLDLIVHVSRATSPDGDPFFTSALTYYNGKRITLPEKFRPAEEFLAYHGQHVYRG